jgi:hypothetical protein
MKIGHRQQINLSCFTPSLFGTRLTFGTMSIAATVIHEVFVLAVVAPLPAASERRRTAIGDPTQDFQVVLGQPISVEKLVPMATDDVSQFNPSREPWRICRCQFR